MKYLKTYETYIPRDILKDIKINTYWYLSNNEMLAILKVDDITKTKLSHSFHSTVYDMIALFIDDTNKYRGFIEMPFNENDIYEVLNEPENTFIPATEEQIEYFILSKETDKYNL